MGMFDYIHCEMRMPAKLPKRLRHSNQWQTKDTPDQYLTLYTIRKNGTLWWQPYEMVEVPKAERPYPNDDGVLGLMGSVRRAELEPEQLTDFHGDIDFTDGNWRLRARFTRGVCDEITILEEPAQ